MRITIHTLERANACLEQRELFAATFPKGSPCRARDTSPPITSRARAIISAPSAIASFKLFERMEQ